MDPLMSSIMGWGPTWALRQWAFCHGQLLAISANTALFSLIGTTYGGDGRTTFALPELRGRAPIGAGQSAGTSFYPLGARVGAESVTLTQAEMPVHNHAAQITNASAQIQADGTGNGTTNDPTGNVMAKAVTSGLSPEPINAYASSGTDTMAPAPVSGSVTVGNAGGSQPFSIVQPILAINFIIAVQGVFPSRN